MLRSFTTSTPKWIRYSRQNLQSSTNRAVANPTRCIRRSYATATGLDAPPKPGDSLHGFTVQTTKHVPELHLTAIRLQHDKTGADYLHLARDDSNNVFSIGFKTNPPDDTGVPHILEHTTLCGSEKYPIRDPFFKMLPRSLSTFMNAFTSSDHTTYPFSTTNHQDFKNLMSVYLDATLFPLLKLDDFRQEGWRLAAQEGVKPQDYASGEPEGNIPVLFKGIVYNEMKGMMSDAGYVFHVRWLDHIFPAINNSGGDPQKITDLTHKDLVSFHSMNYHPSNAKIFTYGNMPLNEHLTQVGDALNRFERRECDDDIRVPVSLEGGPKVVTLQGPIDPAADKSRQHKTSFTWLTGDAENIEENFTLAVMSSILLDGYGSPMHKALIEADLGTHFTSNTGFDTSAKVGTFSVGVGGVGENSVRKVKNAITSVFEDFVFQGVNDEKVQGVLHQLELGLKHKSAAFGMGMLHSISPRWFNGVDPTNLVVWNDLVSKFKDNYANEGYLEDLVIKYFLNDRYLHFTMTPVEDFGQRLVHEEHERVQKKFKEASTSIGGAAESLERIQQQEADLTKIQEDGRNADLSCLPSLKKDDISRQIERRPVELSALDDVTVYWRKTATNGLTYFKAMHNFDDLSPSLRRYLPLFLDCIMRLGTRDQSMEQLEDMMKLKTGGISFSRHSAISPTDLGHWREGLLCQGFSLDKNVPTMLTMMQKLITETDFKGPKARSMIKELLNSQISGIMDEVANSGHAFARGYASSSLNAKLHSDEEYGGLSQMFFLLDIPTDGNIRDSAVDQIVSKMIEIQGIAISKSRSLRLSITCEPECVSANEARLKTFLAELPSSPGAASGLLFPREISEADSPNRTGNMDFFDLPYQVYYSALAAQTVPLAHPELASLSVLAQLLTHRHLHHEIREKGGAYGGGASLSMRDGFFSMTSYRDPNPLNTLQIAMKAGQWASEQPWTDQDLTEAKLSVFQGLDAPISVDKEADRVFLNGVSDDMMQQFRERLLDVSPSDVKNAANKFLVEGMTNSNVCIIGQNQDWVKARDGWKIHDLRNPNVGDI